MPASHHGIGRQVDADMLSSGTASHKVGRSSSESTIHKVDAASSCSCAYHSIAPESRCESDLSSCSCDCPDCHASAVHHPPCMDCADDSHASACSFSERCSSRSTSDPRTGSNPPAAAASVHYHKKTHGDLESLSASSVETPRRKRSCAWRGSRLCVIASFLALVLGGLLGFFCWPRTPLVSVATTGVELEKARWVAPAGLHSTWLVNITLDNRQNWVPLQVTGLELAMQDSLTRQKFAWSAMDGVALQPRAINTLAAVFHVDYSATDSSDSTFQNLRDACTAPSPSSGSLDSATTTATPAPPIHIVLHVVFHFFAFVWTPTLTVTPETGGFICPGQH